MSVKSTRGTINKAVRDLNVSWQQCKNYWADSKSKEFEEKYIAPLPDAVTATSSIIDEIDKILTKIKRDCE
ncbi:MAG TPA: hypothetical protein EYG40_14210 [Verrucomicrobia bacterium]|jgi:hypothetical protein|nr:hypothetical protein [Verrucomicrobiales bacterium]HIG84243.1 hypothetical protein [Verrucomicrobiales bacterium]HIL56175.1 hypothetical protein [Verrucomicrobiota bacterium]|tara:strand:+ start:1055 stop:1267 length:213 start_codon:yes stop_codon:yes gene_type:complete